MAQNPSGRKSRPTTERIYVKVNSDFDTIGNLTPRDIIWDDGRRFEITRVLDVRPGTLVGKGANYSCYTVLIGSQQRMLFFERLSLQVSTCVGRWFVELTLPHGPASDAATMLL